MARKKDPLKQTTKDITSLTGLGVTTSVGSLTLGKIGGTAATSAQAGLQSFSRVAFPVSGLVMGARTALGLTKSLVPELGKKKRKL